MNYILELELKHKNNITDGAINDICKGVRREKEDTPTGYRLMADNMNDMGSMYIRTMASLIIRGYLKKGVYISPDDGVSDCTDSLLCDPEAM